VRRVRWIGVVAIAAALFVGACGDDSEEESSGAGSGSTQEESSTGGGGGGGSTVRISASEFKFDPANPKVAKAGKVKFELSNDGQFPHALEVEGPGGEAETETIQPGESATLEADLSKPGSYTMYCPVGNHRDQGMEGKITVAGGGSGGSSSSSKEEEKEDDKGGSPSGY